MKRLLPTFVALCGLFLAAGRAVTNEIAALTLEEALARAERHHPDLAEARAFVDASDGRVQQAGAWPNPEAIARVESAPLKGRTLDQAEYLGGFAQPLPLGNRRASARQAASLEREQRILEIENRRRDLRKRVHTAFATALYQDQAREIRQSLVASAETIVNTTRARLEAGEALPADLARAEMELAQDRAEFRRVGTMHRLALTALSSAIGEPSLLVRSLDGSLEAAFEIPTLESVASTLESHPAIAAADAELQASTARLNLAGAERVPEVRVELLYRRVQEEDQNAFDLGISLPLPLFDRSRGRLREARAEVAAAEARARSKHGEVTLRLRDTYAQFETALAGSRTLKTEILPRIDLVLKAGESRHRAGDISLGELLPIRREWASAQLRHLESLRDVMQSWAALTPFLKEGK